MNKTQDLEEMYKQRMEVADLTRRELLNFGKRLSESFGKIEDFLNQAASGFDSKLDNLPSFEAIKRMAESGNKEAIIMMNTMLIAEEVADGFEEVYVDDLIEQAKVSIEGLAPKWLSIMRVDAQKGIYAIRPYETCLHTIMHYAFAKGVEWERQRTTDR